MHCPFCFYPFSESHNVGFSLVEANLHRFVSFVYICICIATGDLVIKRRVGIPLNGLTSPHCCACPKPRPGFPASNVVIFFVLMEWRSDEIVRFVNIGGIDYHHCLNSLSLLQTHTFDVSCVTIFSHNIVYIYWKIEYKSLRI